MVRECRVDSFRNMLPIAIQLLLSSPATHKAITYQLDLVLGQHGARLPRGQLQEHVTHRYPALALLP